MGSFWRSRQGEFASCCPGWLQVTPALMCNAACAPAFRWNLSEDRGGLEPHAGKVVIRVFSEHINLKFSIYFN
jgi:hypothetical protein